MADGLMQQPIVRIAELRGTDAPPAETTDRTQQYAFLSTVTADRGDKRLALIVVLLSALAFVVAVPFAKFPLAHIDAFIPAYEAALILIDAITAVMLLGQFRWARSPALLVLAAGYLYDAMLTLAHFASFPGTFSATGLLGAGGEITPWLYTFWHAGFPLFIIGYAAMSGNTNNSKPQASENFGRVAVALTIAGAIGLAVGLIVIAMHADAMLPAIMAGNKTTNWMPLIVTWAAPMAAIAVLLRQRRWTVLNLWLIVVSCAWVFDVGLSSVFNSGRYDLGFYAGRGYGLLAASFVLGVLLVETAGLHSRLAAAKVLLGDYARQLEERVRARTSELEAETAERQKAEAQLHKSQKMEALGQLTGGLAHDFNNHLGIIIGNLDLLGDQVDLDADQKELVDEALAAAFNGAELTKSLLAFARRQALRPQHLDANRLIEETTKLLRRTLGEQVEIDLDLDTTIPAVIADPSQLESAIANLANNARDAMPGGGQLSINTGVRYLDEDYAAQHVEVAPGAYVMIQVSDTGSGMSPETLAKVFEPFFTTKEPGKGTGLGLSMVFGFLKQSGGHINVYSEFGRGTTFRLYLRPDEAIAAEAGAPSVAVQLSGGGERVLVVDDNAKLRTIVVRQLGELGYRIVEAENAADALKLLDDGIEVDLLLTDIVMPGELDGCDLAREFMLRRPEGKVLLTSGFPGTRLANVDGLGVTLRLLDKPYSKLDLARMLRRTLSEPPPGAELDVALTRC